MEMNFEKMCRTCMCEGRKMFPLFPDDKDLSSFPEMIMTITAVKVVESDGLPCQVCVQCVSSLDTALNFKKLCEKSDSIFRQHLVEKPVSELPIVKQESSNDDNSFEVLVEDTNVEIGYDDKFLLYKSEPEGNLESETLTLPVSEDERKGKSSKVYRCNVCGKGYTGSKSLKRHLAIHQGEGHKCNQCQRVFSRRDHLRKHLEKVHSVKDIESVMNEIAAKPIIKYDCEFCGVDAPNKVSMGKHMRACHKDKLPKRKNSVTNNYESFISGSDDNSNSQPDAMIEIGDVPIKDDEDMDDIDDQNTVQTLTTGCGGAIATIKEEKGKEGAESRLVLEVRYCCAICGVKYDNQHSYAAHMTKHSGPIPKGQTHFNCVLCDKVFTKRKNLKQHALTHNKEKANKCNLCHRAFTRSDQLILHMNNHTGKKRHQCTHCDKGFNMLSTLKDHLRTHSGEKPFLCSICGKGFTQNTNLKQHLMRHSATKPFGCPTCLSRFVSKGELDAHLRKHTGDHPFVCDTCGTGFTTSSSLVKHKRIHSGERPYACDLCPLKFTALGTLKNHRRTHTGEKPYSCTYCSRAFAQKSDLVAHIRTHTGERPYVCNICGTPYQQSSALKVHIKVHHPLVVNKVPMESQLSTNSSDRDNMIVTYKSIPECSPSPNFVNADSIENKYNME